MNDAKPVNTPISQDIYMEEKTTIKEDDNKKHHLNYREVVGSLMYFVFVKQNQIGFKFCCKL